MQWLAALLPPLVLIAGWLYTVSVVTSKFPKLRNKKICLLIAHPDDEAMFFSPTLVALTNPDLGNHVKILCLSSDGLGETRKKELVKSGMLLGLRQEDDVFVVESPDFEDSMTKTWDAQKISNLLSSAFAPHLAKPQSASKNTQAPTATIDVLITFDQTGISSHPNHISLYHGARRFISSLIADRPGWQCPVDMYTLTGISIVRKYTSIFDSLVTLIAAVVSGGSKGDHPSPLLFLSGPQGVRIGQQAMTNAHVSQMRWFRWGWIGLSRYMAINDLRLEKVS
ncbi:LmbE-like protein [Coleophoma cylindrospora]|uniref:N-acetylglucosaminylphosphatidylinositol deacetylase n=1 Tax=Coleophoma cylindrospora TaxID=1849047 RepID=A0A3D8SQT7_9HELO|nr:LmbE-like protein [Coleophoma cylindrospora]